MSLKFRSLCEGKIYQWEEIISNPVVLKNTLLGRGAKPLLFTGYHDLEGVEIYEGDILQYFDGRNNINEYYYVEWGRAAFAIRMFVDKAVNDLFENAINYPHDDNIRVVGNIYENQDLVSKIIRECDR